MTAPRLLAFANNVEATVAADVGDWGDVEALRRTVQEGAAA